MSSDQKPPAIAGIETQPAMRKQYHKELRTLKSRHRKARKHEESLYKKYRTDRTKADRAYNKAARLHESTVARLKKVLDRELNVVTREIHKLDIRTSVLEGRLGL